MQSADYIFAHTSHCSDLMKVLHKPTGELRMIKVEGFDPLIHERIEVYRNPRGQGKVTTIYTSDGSITRLVEKKSGLIVPHTALEKPKRKTKTPKQTS